MKIIQFTESHMEEAIVLAKERYERERRHTPVLPADPAWPDMGDLVENGLGAAAFEGGKMVGFLSCCGPFENAFGSTRVKGMFSPMHGNAAAEEDHGQIYAELFEYCAGHWVKAGAVSYGICLYPHDHEGQKQFFRSGFGLRCLDALRPMEPLGLPAREDVLCREVTGKERGKVYPLKVRLDQHMGSAPCFICRRIEPVEKYLEELEKEKARIFVAEKEGEIVAFLKTAPAGETLVSLLPQVVNLTGAYCLPEHRGGGIAAYLLDYVIRMQKKEGFTHLGVDFESINPTAYRFWLKHFSAYTHSVVRRIDELALEKNY